MGIGLGLCLLFGLVGLKVESTVDGGWAVPRSYVRQNSFPVVYHDCLQPCMKDQLDPDYSVWISSTQAFVEMGSKDQAGDIEKYFSSNPLEVERGQVVFSVSDAFKFLKVI